jgi:hypothetical protein
MPINRRMRKTARPVVWEGAGAQSPALDLIMSGEMSLPLRVQLKSGYISNEFATQNANA